MRFNQFYDSLWIKTSLKDVAKKINAKNKNKFCKNVISNSAQHGLIRQIDYFDKEIAQNESIENYTIINKKTHCCESFYYSYLIASIGSRRAALRAGYQPPKPPLK